MSTGMIWQTSSTGSADTERLGEELGKLLDTEEVIELRSDLGGGKTTFVRGLARGLGSKDLVSSPTFTLSKVYKGRGDLEIHHFDFYRLREPGVIADQLAESLDNPKVITAVEWSSIVKDVLPEERLIIGFEPAEMSPDERKIIISYPASKTEIISRLQTTRASSKP